MDIAIKICIFEKLSNLGLTEIMSLETRVLNIEVGNFYCPVCFRGILDSRQTSLLELFYENS